MADVHGDNCESHPPGAEHMHGAGNVAHQPRRADQLHGGHGESDAHGHRHGDHGRRLGGHSHAHAPGGRMVLVLSLTTVLMGVEFVAAIITGSLALLADAGHMLSDVAAQALALLAIWFAAKPATAGKSFGYYRTEILASLVNGVVLVGMSLFIIVEGIHRLADPPEVAGGLMLAVAVTGLIVNLISMRVLHGVVGDSLNLKAAYLELLGDMLASAGVVVAAAIVYFTGWYIVDPVISILIGLAILPRTWLLLAECTNILMEGTPGHIDMEQLHAALLAIPGVTNVHDIHVWSITSGFEAMCAHVGIGATADADAVLAEVTRLAQSDFSIRHTTIQIERM